MAEDKKEVNKEYLIKLLKVVLLVTFIANSYNEKDKESKSYAPIHSCMKYIYTFTIQTLSELGANLTNVVYEIAEKTNMQELLGVLYQKILDKEEYKIIKSILEGVNSDAYKKILNSSTALVLDDYETNNASNLQDMINMGN